MDPQEARKTRESTQNTFLARNKANKSKSQNEDDQQLLPLNIIPIVQRQEVFGFISWW